MRPRRVSTVSSVSHETDGDTSIIECVKFVFDFSVSCRDEGIEFVF
jgi:hypothetical protein